MLRIDLGAGVYNRFRDLEKADSRRPDAVLVATVASFEDLAHPNRQQQRQFAELFEPLFRQSSAETRRTAVAALSRCPAVPGEVATLITEEPIDVSAPFIVNSASLDDASLARIIAQADMPKARAIARRKALSSRVVVSALAGTGDAVVLRSLRVRRLLPAEADADERASQRLQNEEKLRAQLRSMVGAGQPHKGGAGATIRPPLATNGQMMRLAAFAEQRQPLYFVTALADTLDCSFHLAERIMLDISGRQLAETLTAIGFEAEPCGRAIQSFFPHLGRRSDGQSASERLLAEITRADAAKRLTLWLRADRDSHSDAKHASHIEDNATLAERHDGRTPRPVLSTHPARRQPLRRAQS